MIINNIKKFLENEPLIKQLKLDCNLPTKQKCNKELLDTIMNHCKNIIYNKNELIFLIQNKNNLENFHIFCPICGKKNKFYNRQFGYSRYCCTKCALHDKQTIDKIINTKRNTIKNGLNILQISALKAKQTSLNNIDENGNNSYQRATIQRLKKLKLDIDKNGLNGLQRIARKGAITAKNNIDEFGKNSYERGSLKIVQRRKNDIDVNGLDSYQRGARKGVITKKSTIDENGFNIYQKATIKAVQTKRNDIDENGLNGIQRAIEKGHQTNLIRIGVENPFSSEDPKLNGRATKEERYGDPNWTNREQSFETCYKNHGVKSVLSFNVIRQMGIKAAKQPKSRQKAAERHFQHYGVKYSFQRLDYYKKLFNDLFGVENYSQTQQFKDLYKNKEWVNNILKKQYETKKINGTFCISEPENMIYQFLIYKFDEDFNNVLYQYKDKNRYNFQCDFYIKSLDLFIEINFDPSHGKEPFDSNNLEHIKLVEKWKLKSKELNFKNCAKNRYLQFIITWTFRDPLKFKTAKQNNLNYLAFYNWEQFYEWYCSLSTK